MPDKFLCPSTEMDVELGIRICKIFFCFEEVVGTMVHPEELVLDFHSVNIKKRELCGNFSFKKNSVSRYLGFYKTVDYVVRILK